MLMKTCKVCNVEKNSTDFYPNRRKCKSCHAESGYAWRNDNKERWLDIVRESKQRHYPTNRDKILQRNTEWKLANPELVKQINKETRLRHPETFARSRKLRQASIKRQTPCWADKKAMNAIYKEARASNLEVDHVIPLQGKNVCGLHVENNLQLLTRAENRKKSNHYECDHFERRR